VVSIESEQGDTGRFTYCMNAVAMITPEPKNLANLSGRKRISMISQIICGCCTHSNTAVGTHFDLRKTIGSSVPTSEVT
jgi:hypothetical protein